MLRFLLRPRWLVLLAITLVVSTTCVKLANWQWHRLNERRAYIAAVDAGASRPPTPLAELFPAGGVRTPEAYRRVVATGRYDVAHEIVLYGRTLKEQPGNHLLTPLILPDGRAVIVDRGWVPFEMNTPPVAGALPPAGAVTVTGVLEPTDPPGQAGPAGGRITTTTTVDVAMLARQLPYQVVPMYLWLQSQSPGQPNGEPSPAPLPPLDEGPHLGYLIQWLAFAVIFLGGYALLVWREVRRSHETAPSTQDEPARIGA
jgi:cytochrome oxidase assembly protein ShyY1